MKLKLVIALFVLFFAGCKKDKFSTKPQLFYRGTTANVIGSGGFFNMTIGFTDKEGDIQDSIWIQRVSKVCPGTLNTTAKYKIPNFNTTKSIEGDFLIFFSTTNYGVPYFNVGKCAGKDDTSYFRFWAKDLQGNFSDTIQSENIVILK